MLAQARSGHVMELGLCLSVEGPLIWGSWEPVPEEFTGDRNFTMLGRGVSRTNFEKGRFLIVRIF